MKLVLLAVGVGMSTAALAAETITWTDLVNSADVRCKLTVPVGVTLDLGGKSQSARRLTGDLSQIVNGTLTELNPKRGLLMVVR